jgi:hypothetical protein
MEKNTDDGLSALLACAIHDTSDNDSTGRGYSSQSDMEEDADRANITNDTTCNGLESSGAEHAALVTHNEATNEQMVTYAEEVALRIIWGEKMSLGSNEIALMMMQLYEWWVTSLMALATPERTRILYQRLANNRDDDYEYLVAAHQKAVLTVTILERTHYEILQHNRNRRRANERGEEHGEEEAEEEEEMYTHSQVEDAAARVIMALDTYRAVLQDLCAVPLVVSFADKGVPELEQVKTISSMAHQKAVSLIRRAKKPAAPLTFNQVMAEIALLALKLGYTHFSQGFFWRRVTRKIIETTPDGRSMERLQVYPVLEQKGYTLYDVLRSSGIVVGDQRFSPLINAALYSRGSLGEAVKGQLSLIYMQSTLPKEDQGDVFGNCYLDILQEDALNPLPPPEEGGRLFCHSFTDVDIPNDPEFWYNVNVNDVLQTPPAYFAYLCCHRLPDLYNIFRVQNFDEEMVFFCLGLMGLFTSRIVAQLNLQVCMFIKGAPNSGKSTLQELMALMVGERYFTVLDPASDSHFWTSALHQLDETPKYLVSMNDISDRINQEILHSLKEFISNGTARITRKNMDSKMQRIICGFLLVANFWIKLGPDSGAFYHRRVMPIVFNHTAPNDPQFKDRLLKQHGLIKVVCALAARRLLYAMQDGDLWSVAPSFVKQQRDEYCNAMVPVFGVIRRDCIITRDLLDVIQVRDLVARAKVASKDEQVLFDKQICTEAIKYFASIEQLTFKETVSGGDGDACGCILGLRWKV